MQNAHSISTITFDRKFLLKLVIPLVIEQILAVTVGMADMIMVSGDGCKSFKSVDFNLLFISRFHYSSLCFIEPSNSWIDLWKS